MDGIHDLGGMHGFGPVSRDTAPHGAWEDIPKALLYLGAAKLRKFNVDQYRHAVERIPPQLYLTSNYFERALTGIATLYVEAGLVSHEELEKWAGGHLPLARPIGPGRANPPPPVHIFQAGDCVKVRELYVSGHVRMPAYVRGKAGVVIERDIDVHFPDAAGHGAPADCVPTYHVEFVASELWPDAEPGNRIIMSLCHDYLEQRDWS
ncbi:SH3-like domain-containing protein [Cupriavidus sp. CP313]